MSVSYSITGIDRFRFSLYALVFLGGSLRRPLRLRVNKTSRQAIFLSCPLG